MIISSIQTVLSEGSHYSISLGAVEGTIIFSSGSQPSPKVEDTLPEFAKEEPIGRKVAEKVRKTAGYDPELMGFEHLDYVLSMEK